MLGRGRAFDPAMPLFLGRFLAGGGTGRERADAGDQLILLLLYNCPRTSTKHSHFRPIAQTSGLIANPQSGFCNKGQQGYFKGAVRSHCSLEQSTISLERQIASSTFCHP